MDFLTGIGKPEKQDWSVVVQREREAWIKSTPTESNNGRR